MCCYLYGLYTRSIPSLTVAVKEIKTKKCINPYHVCYLYAKTTINFLITKPQSESKFSNLYFTGSAYKTLVLIFFQTLSKSNPLTMAESVMPAAHPKSLYIQ